MITFDFDETLTRPVWDSKYRLWIPSELPNLKVMAKLKKYHQLDKKVCIVSTRYSASGINKFVEKYELPINDIHCTHGKLKGPLLMQINSVLHFDDAEEEAIRNQTLGITTMLLSYEFDESTQGEQCIIQEYTDKSGAKQ